MPVGAIVIFPIMSNELDDIEKAGPPRSTIFAIMLALLGIGVGGLISLLLAAPPGEPTLRYMLVVVLVALSLLVGAVLGIVWLRWPNPIKPILAKIRERDATPAATPMLPAPLPSAVVPTVEPAKVPKKP